MMLGKQQSWLESELVYATSKIVDGEILCA
jgi:hypothetical protein